MVPVGMAYNLNSSNGIKAALYLPPTRKPLNKFITHFVFFSFNPDHDDYDDDGERI